MLISLDIAMQIRLTYIPQQRLGTVTLKQDDGQAIELFDWAGIAITKADALEKQLSSLSHRCHLAEDTIQQLNKQLEELIDAKSQHEDQLVANFAQLLNEKKLKIRNQQRLLASATVDPEKGMPRLEDPELVILHVVC